MLVYVTLVYLASWYLLGDLVVDNEEKEEEKE